MTEQEIIDFINSKYEKEIPRMLKPVIKRKAKKIESIRIEDFPESFRQCTIEELITILKRAHKDGQLKF